MTPSPAYLDALIEEITVDCPDDEEIMGSENALDEQANLPCPGTVIGEPFTVLAIAVVAACDRRELIATCEHHDQHYQLALPDIELDADPTTQPSSPSTAAGQAPDDASPLNSYPDSKMAARRSKASH